jgi:glycolate oxidase FAD binding subunit
MGGEPIEAGEYWTQLREQRLPFFGGDRALWRICVPQACEPLALPFAPLVEWGGGLRWVSGEADPLAVRSTAERAGGHATLFRGGDRSAGVFHPLKPPVLKIHKRLKEAFDPAGILNPNRMYKF